MKSYKEFVTELKKTSIKVVLPSRDVVHMKNWLRDEFFGIEPDTVETLTADTSEVVFSIYGSKYSIEKTVLKDIKKLFRKAFVEVI